MTSSSPSRAKPASVVLNRWKDWRLWARRRIAARFVSDRRYLSALYRGKFGVSPDLDEPQGFNEKIVVKILIAVPILPKPETKTASVQKSVLCPRENVCAVKGA